MGVPGPGTNVAAGTTHLGTLDVNTGTFTQISPNSLASVTSATGAALDPVTQTFYFQTQTDFVATSMQTGLPTAQNPITNPIQQTYFDNYRYNTSDSTIYGIARHTVSGGGLGQATTDLYLASINPATGVVTQISPQSIGNMYALQGCAINPHEMVYYYSNQGKIIGLDLYTGWFIPTQPLLIRKAACFSTTTLTIVPTPLFMASFVPTHSFRTYFT